MANYIHALQAQLAAKNAEIAALHAQINDFRIYLATNPKFGNRPILDGDGLFTPQPAERLDWISTSDVLRRLAHIELAGLLALEAAEG